MNEEDLTYSKGDKVRLDIPDESDIDHKHHGKVGQIRFGGRDDLDKVTENPEDAEMYVVDLMKEPGTVPARLPDLEPVEEDDDK